MPDIRDLLRGAADRPGAPLDLERVRGRAQQRRRRRASLVGAGAVTMVVVIVAAGLYLARDEKERSELAVEPPPTTLAPTNEPVVVPVNDVTTVAVGKNTVWVGRSNAELVQLDPETFTERSTAEVVAPVTAVALGHNAIWSTGRSNEVPQGMVARNDIGTEGMARQNLLDDEFDRSPGPIAIGPTEVWIAESDHNQVIRIDPTTNTLAQVPLSANGTSITADASGAWIGTEGPLLHVTPTASMPTKSVIDARWVTSSRIGLYGATDSEVFTIDPEGAFVGTSAGTPLRLRGVGGKLAADPLGDGVWVADRDGVKYVRPQPVTGTPTELGVVADRQLPGVSAKDLVADGTYVWIVTDKGELLRWRPPPG